MTTPPETEALMPGLPNLLDWIVPDQLAACVNPGLAGQVVDALRAQRFDVVINLFERRTPGLVEKLGVREVHLPVRDFTPPTQAQLDAGVAEITQALAAGQRVAVHCGAGLGRTGTLVAAYFVTQGLDPAAAVARVRALRPGSVETVEQEQAVVEFATRQGPSGGNPLRL